MGGRGSSSRMSGKAYGTEYTTVLKSGNIKFVKINEGNTTAPMETATKGRVYVTLDYKDEPKFITYYSTENKRSKQIDLDHFHKEMSPHTHHGYNHNEYDGPKGAASPTTEERRMVERVKKIWYNRNGKM